MARSNLSDFLQSYPFWLMDVAPVEIFSLPLFTPSSGFSSITAPELKIETKDIVEGNWHLARKVVKKGSISPITLSRGASFWDSDFWRWILFALTGEPVSLFGINAGAFSPTFGGATPRRDLLLIQFFAHLDAEIVGALMTAGLVIGTAAMSSGSTALNAVHAGISFGATAALGATRSGPFEFTFRVPARAWVLHNCIDVNTEVLAASGWVRYDEISKGDSVYSLNLGTNKLELVPVTGYVKRSAKDDHMVALSGKSMNFRVTDEHGFYVRSGVSKLLRRLTANELFEASGELEVPVSGFCSFPGVSLTDDELRLIAWFITDGHLKESQRLVIAQSKEYKSEIRALLTRLGLHFTESILPPSAGRYANAKPCHLFGVPKGTSGLVGWYKYRDYLVKTISPLLHQMTREQFLVFWTELVKGDGSFRRRAGQKCADWSSSQLACSLPEQADALMQMAVLRGVSMSCHTWTTPMGHEMYILIASDKQWTSVRPARMRNAKDPLTRIRAKENDVVWCVSNRNQTLIARRGGRVMILGNCIPTRYKTGSEFDAKENAVSIMELELEPEAIEEFSLTA